MMKKLYITIFVFTCCFFSINAQVATAVLDDEHNATSSIEGAVKSASAALKKFFTSPTFEKISKVQKFLKATVQLVSVVVANLKMTRELIEAEQDIFELYTRCVTKISEAEDLEDKWKYKKVLVTLFGESIKAFEVFDLATQQNMGIIDDRGRIELIKQVLKKTKQIRMAMRITLRRANQQIIRFRRKKKELETFRNLFVF